MTVLEAANKLMVFFSENNHFEFPNSFSKKPQIAETEPEKAAILIALEEFEKQKFVTKKNVEEREFWVLNKPLLLQAQEIQINFMTAISIAEVINQFIEKEEEKISPLSISERDILNLIELAKKT